jgi:hypothetical protein
LAVSQKVKIIFRDSIKDLDEDILCKAKENAAAKIITKLRTGRISRVEDLLITLGPRYTSWLKDRAAIAGLLARISIPDLHKDTFQRDIYQSILKSIGKISHDHLFHKFDTMSRGFSWCATSLFQLPKASIPPKLRIGEDGEVVGPWKLLSISNIDSANCVWGGSHALIEAKILHALVNEKDRHLVLIIPPETGSDAEDIEKGLLVEVFKNPCEGNPSFKCQFVGPLYFHPALKVEVSATKQVTIGDTETWKQLNENEDAWKLLNEHTEIKKNRMRHGMKNKVGGSVSSQTSESVIEPGWTELHRDAWLQKDVAGDKRKLRKLRKLLPQRDELGRRALHLAAERGNKKFVEMLLEAHDDPNDPDSNDANLDGLEHIRPGDMQTPLHHAAWGGFMEGMKLLLERARNTNTMDRAGNTILHPAAK